MLSDRLIFHVDERYSNAIPVNSEVQEGMRQVVRVVRATDEIYQNPAR